MTDEKKLLSPSGWLEIIRIDRPQLYGLADHEWQHAAASSLHGWALHKHHEGTDILMDKKTYLMALQAVSGNDVIPIRGALSPHRKGVPQPVDRIKLKRIS